MFERQLKYYVSRNSETPVERQNRFLCAERLNDYIELRKFSSARVENTSIPRPVLAGSDTSRATRKSVSQQVVEIGKTVDTVTMSLSRVNGEGPWMKGIVISVRRFNSEKSAA